METQPPVDGTLNDTPLPDLLAAIASDGTTGVLRITDGSEIWFSGGRIYLATTASSPDLAKVLFDGNVGPPDLIAAALAGDRRADDTEGLSTSAIDRLLADRPESSAAIERLLHEFSLNSLFEMLVPSEAGYRLEDGTRHPIGDRFAEDTDVLIDKAKQRLEIWRRIAARIPSTTAVFTLARRLPDQLDQRLVTADEWRFLSLLDGQNTVADVINETGESAFRVCSSLYRLLLENMVEEANEPART